MSTIVPNPDHQRAALQISWVTICWSSVTGVLAIVVGLSAASLALIGSGASVLIDVSSSVVLVWRFRHPHGHEHAERRAQIFAVTALVSLATILGASSIYRLVTGGRAHPTGIAVGVAIASIVALPLIASRKYVVAARVPSAALRTDAHITMVGASTAALTVVGLALTNAGHPDADAAAALAVSVIALALGGFEARQHQS